MIQKMDLHKIGYYNDGFPPAQLEFYDKYHKIKDHNSCEGAEDACQSK